MRTLFKPATALMNRLRYPAKFFLLGAAIGLVMLVLLATVYINLKRDIDTAENELAGLQMLKPLNLMVQHMQQHRGLSSGVLNGNEAMRAQRAAKEQDVEAALAEVTKMLTPELSKLTIWRQVNSEWQTIRRDGLNWAAPDNLKRHSAMIADTLTFMVDVADEMQLTADPHKDTFYLMDAVVSKMPAMLEPLGITRARGTGVLTRKELSPQLRNDITTLVTQMSATLKAQNDGLAKTMRDAPELEAKLRSATQEFTTGVEKIFALVHEDILGERFNTPPQEYFAETTRVIDLGYKIMFETLIPEFEKQLQGYRAAAWQSLAFYFGFSILIMLVVGYLGFGAYYSVISSVETFSEGAGRLASGDLTVEFHVEGNDELHAAGRSFNEMAVALRQMLERIQNDVLTLRSSAEQLADSSQQILHGAGVQSSAASSMAAAVEEMTAGVDHISSNAEEAQKSSQQSDATATAGGRIVASMVDNTKNTAQAVNQAADSVEALGRQSEAISAIVGTIRDIADQTNLLALNAAIEAARAGEAGRGFAVVADEVRKLAERTAKSTREISDMISAIQEGTNTAVASMRQSMSQVAAGVEEAQQAGAAIEQIKTWSAEVVGAVAEISEALREQATANSEISQTVERIAQMSEENNSAASANADTAAGLHRIAETLGQEVARFRT